VLAAGLFGNQTPVIISRRVAFAVSSNPLSARKYNHPIVKRIICVSDAIRKITAPSIRDQNKLVVVHSGIDLALYEKEAAIQLRDELNLSREAILVGNLSALADHKDYPTFIQTAKVILSKREDVHFVIAGSGREEKKIRHQIRNLGLDKNIHLLGFRNDPVSIMQSLDVFLITSVTEGLGTIVLEAFAAGVPVVATRAGGLPEMVQDGVTGMLADIKDADALANAVLHILDDSTLRDSLIRNAKKRVQDFAYQVTAQRTLEIYEAVLAGT
jgi:glycosyltransferase involved in cell wall biosynthesis